MPMQSRTSLAALMTVSLAVATPLVFTQIGGAWAQSSGGGGSGGSGGSAGAGGSGGSTGAGGTGPSATSGGSTTGSGSSAGTTGSGAGSTGTSAGDRGGSGTGRTMGDTTRPGATTSGPGMSNTQPGTMDRDYNSRQRGMSNRDDNNSQRGMTNRDSTGSSMQGSSGTDATSRGGSGSMRGTGETGSLVGTEKLNAALGALEGTSGNRSRRGASTARVVQMEEYETAMRNALAVEDPAQRSAAVAEARERLQRATNRQVSPDVIARVDSILGLPATSTTR